MSINLANHGTVTGNLAQDPKIYSNSDGSQTVYITVAARNNFKSKDGNINSQFIDLEAFVPKDGSMGALEYLKKGMRVTLAYSVVCNRYEKDGETVYTQKLQIYRNDIILPPKGDNTSYSDGFKIETVGVDDDWPFC